jgi:thiamine-phosphate pyrophosphorylase
LKGLYAIVDEPMLQRFEPVQLARAFLEGGASVIQLRLKTKKPSEIVSIARGIASLKRDFSFPLIINDYPELVDECGADGLHIGQGDMSPQAARALLGPNKIIGLSTHSREQAQKAQTEPLTYMALGAIFPTTAKPADHPVVGTGLLREVVGFSRWPVVAIGGIHRGNFHEVVATGVPMACMMTALIAGDTPQENALFFSRGLRPDID